MNREVIQSLAFAIPALCALACMAFVLIDAFHPDKNRQERRLRLFIALTFAVAALYWTGLMLQVSFPRAFVHCQPAFIFTLMMNQVLIYHFVHTVTSVRSRDRFSLLHIALPVALTAFMAVSDSIIPFERRIAILYNADDNILNRWYEAIYRMPRVVFVLYHTFYPALGLLRIRRYRHVIVNYSANTQRSSLNWLRITQLLTLLTIPVPLAGLLLKIEIFNNFRLSMPGVLPTFFVYPILCYNLLSDNFERMKHDDERAPVKSPVIDPKRFDKYLKDKRPYMNSKIHITDMATALYTNNKYVSTYINSTYGMSFSRFINRCRLEELERLRRSPQMAGRGNMELVLMAGFSNYRSYLRVKKEEDRENRL